MYQSLGIELFDTNGQLLSSYEIFSQLANIWPTLDKNTQNYIATTQAGEMMPLQSEYAGTSLEPCVLNFSSNVKMA